MYPRQFDYVAPTSLEEAFAALGDDSKVMAGGTPGGAFGDDNFRRSLLSRLSDIQVSVGKLANDLTAAAQKLASDPRVRETAAKAARVVVDEAEQIARREDKALNAGRAVRRFMNKLQGRST